MSARSYRVSFFVMLVTLVSLAAYYFWPSAAEREAQAITERVAVAAAHGDRAALANEPCFRDHPETIDLLLRHSPALANGYRIAVGRNGMGGHSLMSSDVVTHIGEIKTASATITLGFRHNRDSGQLQFVTASFSGLGSASAKRK